MRIVTLLPAATEIVAALGGAGRLVGISHECDYPPAVTHLPRVTVTPVDTAAPGAAIDAEVRRLREAGRPVIALETGVLRRLAPDLVIVQGLCEVCAVADGQVHRLVAALHPMPRVLSLGASTLAGIFDDIGLVAAALGLESEADELIAGLRYRLDRIRAGRPATRARVLCIEWLDPLYLAGHWVPELIEAAGGVDVGAVAGGPSARRDWGELAGLVPDLAVVTLCGFGVQRTRAELEAVEDPDARRFLASTPVWILDGNAYTSRPGPRVVDGAERLRAMFRGGAASGMTRWTAPWPSA